jgi:hypothetical protein
MSDENFHAQHYDTTLEIYGRLIGMEAMVRGLYLKLASEKDEPLSFLEEVLAGLSGAITTTGRADDEVEALLMRHAHMQVAETFEKIVQQVKEHPTLRGPTLEPVAEVPNDVMRDRAWRARRKSA